MEIGCKPSNSIPMHVELVIICECDSNQFKLTWTITNLQYIFFSIFHLHTNTNSDSDKKNTNSDNLVQPTPTLLLLVCYSILKSHAYIIFMSRSFHSQSDSSFTLFGQLFQGKSAKAQRDSTYDMSTSPSLHSFKLIHKWNLYYHFRLDMIWTITLKLLWDPLGLVLKSTSFRMKSYW